MDYRQSLLACTSAGVSAWLASPASFSIALLRSVLVCVDHVSAPSLARMSKTQKIQIHCTTLAVRMVSNK